MTWNSVVRNGSPAKWLGVLIFLMLGMRVFFEVFPYTEVAGDAGCEKPGWFPSSFGLKDHTVFTYNGDYYLMSIYVPGENRFAYGRSSDLCHWEELSPVMPIRFPGSWDETAIWAPHVYQEDGVFYAFYTGVKGRYPYLTQSIMLATTMNPADPTSWQSQGMIFQPDHPGMVWQDGQWADCRDPMVIKQDGSYYLTYTGSDIHGGIVGLARADSLWGPWEDLGAIIHTPIPRMPESPFILHAHDHLYLFYHDTAPGVDYRGERFRYRSSPVEPWSDAQFVFPGWAHEIWPGPGEQLYVSYLTDYTVTIKPLYWDTTFTPPYPTINGYFVSRFFLPIVIR